MLTIEEKIEFLKRHHFIANAIWIKGHTREEAEKLYEKINNE